LAAISIPRVHRSTEDVVTLEGFAYSGSAQVTSVEVSIDYADWMPVDSVSTPPAQLVRWRADWTPPFAGEYSVRIRAVDDTGFIQTETAAYSLFQARQDALHSIIVYVEE
jgi:hypothetical protein